MADIRLQLARYAQGIHWVQKNFLLDESICALLVTAGPMDLPAGPQQPGGSPPSQASHVVLQMQPDFDVPFPAPESWNQQVLPLHATCLPSPLDVPHCFLKFVHIIFGFAGIAISCDCILCQPSPGHTACGLLTCVHAFVLLRWGLLGCMLWVCVVFVSCCKPKW